MKKFLVFASIILVLFLAACGTSNSEDNQNDPENSNENKNNSENNATNNQTADNESNVEIKIGASSTPHAEILEEAKPLLEEKGISLIIEEYTDYVLPNDDLASGDLDANFFQHVPFLTQTIEDTGYELESLGAIHIEPMGIYSQTFASLDEIEDGTEVLLSNSVAEHGRILALIESGGLITLDDSVDKANATLDDIVDNPKNLKFSPDFDPAFLPELYHSETDVLLAINTNYAIDADLNPVEDALVIEGGKSLYGNIIAVRSEDKDNEDLKTVVEVLQSEEIQNFISEKYDGAVIPFTEG